MKASGFVSESLGDVFGPLEYKGYLVLDYPEGDNPINNIVCNVDSTLANNLLIVDVPRPCSYQYSEGVLTLTKPIEVHPNIHSGLLCSYVYSKKKGLDLFFL